MPNADELLDRISGVVDEFRLTNLVPQIAVCRHQLNGGSEGIEVAVFGRFKAGKSSFLNHLNPLQFVDTPGLGSAFVHNTEATRDWLPNVGAALVAVSSDAPLSELDLDLLEELRQHTPKIVLLLTKADLLSDSQRAEVLDFVRKQLQRKWRAELPVFFYSIRPEERALKEELQQKLLSPLVQNRDAAASQIVRHKLLLLVGQTLNYLRVALAAATQAESSRQALREKLADERRQFDLFRSELTVFSREWSASALDWYLARLHPTRLALQEQITRELREQFPRWKLRLPPMLDAWRAWLNFSRAN